MAFWDGLSKRQKQKSSISFIESIQSLKSIPSFLKLIWSISPKLSFINVFLRIIKAVLPLAILYLGKLIIDEVIDITNEKPLSNQLWWYVSIEFGLAIASGLLTRLINLVDALLGDLFANETSVRLIEKSSKLDLPQFENPQFYDKLERARRQTTSRVVLMTQVLTQLQDTISVVALSIGLIAFEPWLIAILILTIAPTFFNETYFNQHGYSLVKSWTPERRELDYLRYIGASDETAKEVKIFGLSNFIKSRFSILANKYYNANKRLASKRAIWGSIFNALGEIGYYLAYIFILVKATKGVISIGDLTFLAGSFNKLRNLLQAMLTRLSKIAESALYLKDYFDFMDIVPAIISPQKPLPIPSKIQQGFIFKNVSFKYPGSEQYALRNVSFELKAGEKLALVGENGAGKTTIVKLLSRLYDPEEGQILLDGQNLKLYDLNELRDLIGVIFQDFVKFYFTASENIAIGDISEKENSLQIESASKQSLAHEFIKDLPNTYFQMLGKRFAEGQELSGGQWQKIALARAYMRKAQLLILDEPTAALDARAEFEAFERFSKLTTGKTAVLISHRFSTVRMADRILVLKNGKVEEIGTHETLLQNKGLYAELFKLQAKGYQ